MTLTKNQQQYYHYHQVKLIYTNFLKVKKYYLFDQRRVIEQAKFTYSHLEKTVEKQRKTTEDQGGKQRKTTEDWG